MRRRLLGEVVATMILGGLPTLAQPSSSGTVPTGDDLAGRRALVVQYMQDIHMDAIIARTMDSVNTATFAAIKHEYPTYSQQRLDKLKSVTDGVMDKELPKIKAATVDSLADVYDREELQALIEFYESPMGRRIVDKMPLASAASQRAVNQMVPEIVDEERKAVCAELGCPAKPKAAGGAS